MRKLTHLREGTDRILTTLLGLALTAVILGAPSVEAAERQSLKSIRTAAVVFARQEAKNRGLQLRDIQAGRLDPRLTLNPCERDLTTFNPYNVPFSHRTTVGVRCEGSKPWTIYVPVSIVTEIEVLTLVNPVQRGGVISRADLAVVMQTDLRGDIAYLVNPANAIGKQAARPLARGTLLQSSMLQNRRIIKKGDRTSVVVRTGGLKVKTTALALEDGTIGDWIALNNPRSGQRVEGTVQADGSVVVGR